MQNCNYYAQLATIVIKLWVLDLSHLSFFTLTSSLIILSPFNIQYLHALVGCQAALFSSFLFFFLPKLLVSHLPFSVKCKTCCLTLCRPDSVASDLCNKLGEAALRGNYGHELISVLCQHCTQEPRTAA